MRSAGLKLGATGKVIVVEGVRGHAPVLRSWWAIAALALLKVDLM